MGMLSNGIHCLKYGKRSYTEDTRTYDIHISWLQCYRGRSQQPQIYSDRQECQVTFLMSKAVPLQVAHGYSSE